MTFADIARAIPPTAVTQIDGLPFPKLASGKVREIFDLGDALLLAATDRLSAFDVILPDGIPGKGIVLTQMSLWWFAQTRHLIPNHLLPDQAGEFARRGHHQLRDLQLRSMIVQKAQAAAHRMRRARLPHRQRLELPTRKPAKSAASGCPPACARPTACPRPIFTPTTKAPKGQHDEPINDAQGAALIGAALYEQVKAASLALYRFGHDRAAPGRHDPRRHQVRVRHRRRRPPLPHRRSPHARLVALLAGATATPSNQSPPSYDKQFVRDYLLGLKWEQKPPAPRLPAEVITRTQEKYLAALRNLLG